MDDNEIARSIIKSIKDAHEKNIIYFAERGDAEGLRQYLSMSVSEFLDAAYNNTL